MKPKYNLHKPVTDHAKQRISERTSLPLKNFKNVSSHIYKHGYRIRSFSGELYEYLNGKQLNGGQFAVRVYEDNIFIFDSEQGRLLTVYPVPERFLPISRFREVASAPCIIWVKGIDGSSQYVCECNMLTEDIGEAVEFRTRQKANNYVKNNNVLNTLERQGYEIIVLDIS